MLLKSIHRILFACGLILGFHLIANNSLHEPYGICAHISLGELDIAEDEIHRLDKIPLKWIRTDFDWAGIQHTPDDWNYSRLDRLLEIVQANDVHLLPILDYDVSWAHPAYQHLDEWCEYVRRTVSRYGSVLRHWEVWNEPNGFWEKPARPEDYSLLLKRSYEVIKAIDPELQVLYGGTSGVPLDYIEASFQAGAADSFDIMNIHPYQDGDTPEQILPQLTALQAMMKRHGCGDKPIWLTEIGWSTADQDSTLDHLVAEAVTAAFRRLGIPEGKHRLAVVMDKRGGGQRPPHNIRHFFTGCQPISLDEIATLSPEEYPVLVPTSNEVFPARYHDALRAYLAQGGTLLLPFGLPFYYDVQLQPDGTLRKVQVNERDVASFHLAWKTWWTHPEVPEDMTFQKAAPGFEDALTNRWTGKAGARFLDDCNLKPGDTFTPIVLAGDNDFEGPVIALYELNSDLKGNIIVNTEMHLGKCVSPEVQAEFLPRTYLIALAAGAERVFWYNFRAWEGDPMEPEHHFGIAHRDLSPKPAYYAFQALAKLCPDGSTRPVLTITGQVHHAEWSTPDGTRCHAIWTPDFPEECSLTAEGTITGAYDLYGRPRELPAKTLRVGPELIYLVGPEKITLKGNVGK
ncbi:MAG: hypothetical protein J5654_00425 [Victivallales bacterium]|nr:hypothetical protein [Victivallales bacterium]